MSIPRGAEAAGRDWASRDWASRAGRRTNAAGRSAAPPLAPPAGLRAVSGRGQVTLHWDPVPAAAGYLVHRSDQVNGPYLPLDHGGGDVLAVAGAPYADTEPLAGAAYYAVAAVADPASPGPLSPPVEVPAGPFESNGSQNASSAGSVTITVTGSVTGALARPWETMIGSEHLSYLLSTSRTGGRVIGAELREALRIARSLGVRAVRAHGILGDDLGVYTESGGEPGYDFSGVDRVFDELVGLGLRPVVELSFMPASLARDPGRTVFSYAAVVSPPRNWQHWADLVERLTEHLIERYGLAEVREHWAFEVWNEPNLEVFWSGTSAEYFHLYDVTAQAIRSVHPSLRVGGPSSAAAGWVEQLLRHVDASGAPLDFLSTHVYGTVPLDFRPALERHGRAGVPIWWTEWGTTPRHFDPVGDSVFAAAFLLRGMRSAAGRVEALSHWVVSDHFEELGSAEELFHGGFGLLSVGNLRKPRFWALALLARLGGAELEVGISGDGAWSLVESVAASDSDGRIGVLAWNGTLNQHHAGADPRLSREVRIAVDTAPGTSYTVAHYRIDETHSNIVTIWNRLRGDSDWPDERQWELLAQANVLEELTPRFSHCGDQGQLVVDMILPMPGISYLELVPDCSGPDGSGPDGNGPDGNAPDGSGPDRSGPDRNGPDGTPEAGA